MTEKRRSRIVVGIWGILAGVCAMYAQGVTGRINGTVRDPSQATVPGATVTVTNQETGYRAEVTTGQGGDYVVPNMPPGKYTVTVAAAGFKVGRVQRRRGHRGWLNRPRFLLASRLPAPTRFKSTPAVSWWTPSPLRWATT